MGQAPMTGSSEPLVSVVVPANNEMATVPAFVEKTAKAFADMGRPWELVYVDDGSSDGTAAAVETEATREPRVRLVRQRRRLGLTEALNRGFREARGDIIVFLPADLESDPEADVPLLLGKLDQGYDVVAADPRHQPRVGVVLAAAAHLPDALVGLVPVVAHPVDDSGEVHPRPVRDRVRVVVVDVDRVDQLAVDVELERVGPGVSDSDGP